MWTAVCKYTQLEPGRGVAALVDGAAVAVFRLGDGSVHAVGNVDPFSGASVISRGITGRRADGTATVASPMYKDVFDLVTGRALDAPEVRLPVYAVRRHRGLVWIGPDVTSVSENDAELLTMATSAA
ncbi:MAG: nitrite reductase small subunit NirD [Catenulispora sp.]|nr:nitrite reductase small subunit NirD [Catenulispora sp.]